MKSKIHTLARLAAVVAGLFVVQAHCFAQFGPQLNKGVEAASTIVIGRMDQYIPEPESMDRMVQERLRSSNFSTGNADAIVLSTVNVRGTYVFTVSDALKGKPSQPLIVRLPRTTGFPPRAAFFSGVKQSFPLKANYLLLLSGDQEHGYVPTTVAPIPIGLKAQARIKPPVDDSPKAVLGAIVRLMVDSLADPETRRSSAFMLSDAVSDEALKAMRPLADDPDDDVRASAIECMAANQDVAAIANVGAWKYSRQGASGNPVNSALQTFKTPAAIPYLNALLNSPDQYTPLNASMALRQIPLDKSSIPFLIKTLRDPENNTAAFEAYYCLCMLIPELGSPRLVISARPVPEQEIARFENWWADEQAGKHASKPAASTP